MIPIAELVITYPLASCIITLYPYCNVVVEGGGAPSNEYYTMQNLGKIKFWQIQLDKRHTAFSQLRLGKKIIFGKPDLHHTVPLGPSCD